MPFWGWASINNSNIHPSICLPLLLVLFTVPSRIVFAKPDDLEMRVPFLDHCQESIIHSTDWLYLSANLLTGYVVLIRDVQEPSVDSNLKGLHSFFNLCCQGPRLAGIQKYESDKSAHISFTLDSRDTSLSLRTGISFVKAAVACAVLESFEPSSDNYFKVLGTCYCSQLLSFYLSLGAISAVNHQFGLFSISCLEQVLVRLSTWDCSTWSSSAGAPVSAANPKLVIVVLPVLTFSPFFFRASGILVIL